MYSLLVKSQESFVSHSAKYISAERFYRQVPGYDEPTWSVHGSQSKAAVVTARTVGSVIDSSEQFVTTFLRPTKLCHTSQFRLESGARGRVAAIGSSRSQREQDDSCKRM